MDQSTLYVGFKDPYQRHYFQEYLGTDDSLPSIIPQRVSVGFTRTSNASDNNLHIVFERPLIMPNALTGYYDFVQNDQSSILFAKHPFLAPRADRGLDDNSRHTKAKILKLNLFAASSCSGTIPALPEEQAILPENFYVPMDSIKKNGSAPPTKHAVAGYLFLSVLFTLSYLLFIARGP